MKVATGCLMGVLLAVGILAGFEGPAQAEETIYKFGISYQRTNISFESVTEFETVLGSSNQVSGQVKMDVNQGTAQIELEVPVTSLNTGIAMRDEHLRSEGWLDAEKHPVVSFVSKRARMTGQEKWTVNGDLTIHGVTKNIGAEVNVRLIPLEVAQLAGLEHGDWMKVSTTFDIKLSDFGVQIPKMAAAKINEVWKVKFQAFANSAPGPMAMNR